LFIFLQQNSRYCCEFFKTHLKNFGGNSYLNCLQVSSTINYSFTPFKLQLQG
jgi:hypothetical protein